MWNVSQVGPVRSWLRQNHPVADADWCGTSGIFSAGLLAGRLRNNSRWRTPWRARGWVTPFVGHVCRVSSRAPTRKLAIHLRLGGCMATRSRGTSKRSSAARKAGTTRKRRAAGKKAATTGKRRAAGQKAATTRSRRAAEKKAAYTRKLKTAAKTAKAAAKTAKAAARTAADRLRNLLA